MPIDPSIAMGVRPVQTPNMLGQYAQAQEMNVNALKMQEAQQAIEDRNALRGLDFKSPDYISQVGKVNPKLALELQKGRTEARTAELDQRAKIGSLLKTSAASVLANPTIESAVMALQSFSKATGDDVTAEFNTLQKIGNNPEAIKKWAMGHALTGDQILAQTDLTANQKAQLGLTKRGQDLQYNPELQGRIETAKAIGKARGEEAVAPLKDIQANVKALKSAGYNPETGADSISDLIQKSTGSYAGAATDFAGRTVGISTGGAKAIASLKTYESKLTQDLLGGKMGAGISNADRDFIVAGIGQIADPTLPVETRQAAWNSVKERMRVAGMVPAPKGEGAPADNPYAKKTDAEIKKELGL